MNQQIDLLPIANRQQTQPSLMEMVLAGKAVNTQIAYSRALDEFRSWALLSGADFDRWGVLEYKEHLRRKGLAPSSVNLALSALRALAKELRFVDGADLKTAEGILAVSNVPVRGRRLGNWFSKDEIRVLMDQCDLGSSDGDRSSDGDSLSGLRNRVLLALLYGAALRCEEATTVRFEQIRPVNGHWVLANVVGKGEKTRSIPLPQFAVAAIRAWQMASGLSEGLVLRAVNKSGRLSGRVRGHTGDKSSGGMSKNAVYRVVKALGKAAGLPLAPHDLRRSWALSAYRQGAPLDQIQLILGHGSLQVTEVYLGLHDVNLDEPVLVEL